MKSSKILVLLAILLAPAVAGADAGDEIHRYGMSVSVGGGPVVLHLGGGADDIVKPVGGGWEARIAFGTKTRLQLEAAYFGSYHTRYDGSGANLLGTGAEGSVQVNLVRGNVQPYLLGGVGWTLFSQVGFGSHPGAMDSDHVVVFPMGGGLSVRLGQLLLDLRAIYRRAASAEMFPDMSSAGAWLRAGFEY